MGLCYRRSFQLEKHADASVPWWTSCRLTLAFVAFFGSLCLYMMRANMSVALVCMTTDPNITTQQEAFMFLGEGFRAEVGYKVGEFDWSRALRGWVMSSFYVGYLCSQVPAGLFANKVGAKVILGTGMLLLAVLTLLTPVAARLSVYALMVLQALKGFASGVYFPAQYQLIGRWAPPHERAVLLGICGAGAPIGTVISSILSGYLCEHGYAGGWPSIFYTFGTFSLVWCLAWYLLVFSSPKDHPRISTEEAEYIYKTLPASSKNKSLHVPWKALFSTVPLYAIFVASWCFSWVWFVALIFLPQYMKDVLGADIQSNGLYSSLPYLSHALLAIVSSVLADLIVSKKVMSLTHVRKLFQTLGMVPSGVISIGVAFLTSDQATLAIILLTFWVGLMTFMKAGSYVNQVDMAAGYAGIIMGIDNTISTIPGIIAPPIVSAMTKTGAPEEWQRVFFVSGGIYLFGWLVYMIFGDAREQEWARTEPDMELEVKSSGDVVIDNPGFVGSCEDVAQTDKAEA